MCYNFNKYAHYLRKTKAKIVILTEKLVIFTFYDNLPKTINLRIDAEEYDTKSVLFDFTGMRMFRS